MNETFIVLAGFLVWFATPTKRLRRRRICCAAEERHIDGSMPATGDVRFSAPVAVVGSFLNVVLLESGTIEIETVSVELCPLFQNGLCAALY